MKKQNRPAWITSIAALILLLVALGLLPYLLIRQSFIITWQNMIGILYEKSPTCLNGICSGIRHSRGKTL